MQGIYVVQRAVIGLAHHRHRPTMTAREKGVVMLDHPLRDAVVHRPDAMGVGDGQGPDEIARVLYPMGARHLAIAVQGELPGPDRLRRACVLSGPDHRDPGPHLAGRVGQGAKAHCDAGHVGDGIEGARRAGKRQPQVTGAGFGHGWVLSISQQMQNVSIFVPRSSKVLRRACISMLFLKAFQAYDPVDKLSRVHPCPARADLSLASSAITS